VTPPRPSIRRGGGALEWIEGHAAKIWNRTAAAHHQDPIQIGRRDDIGDLEARAVGVGRRRERIRQQ
jgi:hypothetical protein